MIPNCYTARQAADILQFSTNTIYKMLDAGELPGKKILGGDWRIPRTAVDNFFEDICLEKSESKLNTTLSRLEQSGTSAGQRIAYLNAVQHAQATKSKPTHTS